MPSVNPLKLLLPALIPSWRFFDEIAPSPRIEFTLLKTAEEVPGHWQEFCPRPEHLPISAILKRLFFNPHWNESLFLVSCSERLVNYPSEEDAQEIRRRIEADLTPETTAPYMQFRLVFVNREGERIQKEIEFTSPLYPRGGDG